MSSEDGRVMPDPFGPTGTRRETPDPSGHAGERRAPGTTRTPFEGLVEVGGALGPSFEAQAVNVSEEGMQLRTAYLPEVGQPLSCRFDAGPGQSVLASGEVVWTQPAERGGEFGVRFTELDGESVDALKRACGVVSPQVQAGSKVRLHIEGLASPMRAKIKDAATSAVTVGSELGFLRVGKQLELEDAESGQKRPAHIDRVDVAVDPASNVPQLVVTLRYTDAKEESGASREETRVARPEGSAAPTPARATDDLQSARDASLKMKGAIARGLAGVAPALEGIANRAKTTFALLAKKRRERAEETTGRRTTAPPPGGGLHASGRRVVRGDSGTSTPEAPTPPSPMQVTKRKAAIGAAVMIAAILGAVAIKKAHHESPAASSTAATVAPIADPAASAALAQTSPSAAASALPATPALPFDPGPAHASNPPANPGPLADNGDDGAPKAAHKHHTHVAPFGNGPVHHGNVLRLKMDGPIESIEGAQQPTGFTVKVPGHKSLEAAAPLAARDARIASIKVSNDPAGAELSVVFKDGVPNYQVSGRGDSLVIALAPVGSLDKTVANKDEKGGKSPKHAAKHHDK
jgi:hypothetical protein